MTAGKIKKGKAAKKGVIKRKLKFENYKSYLEATQIENKINHLEKKNRIGRNSAKKDHEDITKNKLILKTQERFKRERHNVFTEEINKFK